MRKALLVSTAVLLSAFMVGTAFAHNEVSNANSNTNSAKLKKFELNGVVQSVSVGTNEFVVEPSSMSKALKNLNLVKPYTVDVNGNTKFQTSGMKHPGLDDMLPGDRVNIVGKIQTDNSLLATKVNFKRTGFSIVGTITGKAATTFDVMTFVATKNTGLAHDATATIDPTDNAKIKKEGEKITFADLVVGDRIEVNGYITLSGTTKIFNATKIVVYP